MTDLALAPLTAVAQRLQTGDLSPVELTRHLLDRIARLDPRFHSYVTVLDEQAMAQARAAEADLLRGRSRGPLHGIPVAVKDLCCTPRVPRPVERRCSATGDLMLIAPWSRSWRRPGPSCSGSSI